MPGLVFYHKNSSLPPSMDMSSNPEDWKLWLPSDISSSKCPGVCIPNLAEIEEKLHTTQCYDALEGICHVLCVKSRMIIFKNKNIRGQYSGTCSRSVIDRVHQWACAFAEKYRIARQAKVALTGHGDWEVTLRPLLDSDIRGYTDPDRLKMGPGR